jgi:hypothetical protein
MALTGGGLGDNVEHSASDNFSRLVLYRGAGGGGGGACASGEATDGGNGGGVIYIECDRLILSGALSATGADGEQTPMGTDIRGGGAGGGGGIVLVRALQIENTGTVSATGGSGGLGFDGGGNGGNGADGYVDLVDLVPPRSFDVNRDGAVDAADVVSLVNEINQEF